MLDLLYLERGCLILEAVLLRILVDRPLAAIIGMCTLPIVVVDPAVLEKCVPVEVQVYALVCLSELIMVVASFSVQSAGFFKLIRNVWYFLERTGGLEVDFGSGLEIDVHANDGNMN